MVFLHLEISGEQAAAAESPKEESKPAEAAAAPSEGATASASPVTTPTEPSKPVERAIEARSADDSMVSMVRALYFADTFLINGQFSCDISSL